MEAELQESEEYRRFREQSYVANIFSFVQLAKKSNVHNKEVNQVGNKLNIYKETIQVYNIQE